MARMRSTHVAEVAEPKLVSLPAAPLQPVGDDAAAGERAWAGWPALPVDPPPEPAPPTPARWAWLRDCMDREQRPLTLGLLASLVIHAVVLSLELGGQGFGLPGITLPWRDRRIDVPDIRIVLMPSPARVAPAAPAPQPEPPRASLEAPAPAGLAANPAPP